MTKADACVAINQYRWLERVGDTPITQRQETIDSLLGLLGVLNAY